MVDWLIGVSVSGRVQVDVGLKCVAYTNIAMVINIYILPEVIIHGLCKLNECIFNFHV